MKNKKKKGFTLVELLVVIAILAILATVSVVGYVGFTSRANQSNAETEGKQAETVITAELLDGHEVIVDVDLVYTPVNSGNPDGEKEKLDDVKIAYDQAANTLTITKLTKGTYVPSAGNLDEILKKVFAADLAQLEGTIGVNADEFLTYTLNGYSYTSLVKVIFAK